MASDLTPEVLDLDECKRLAEAATPGPWQSMIKTDKECLMSVAHPGIDSLAEPDSHPVVGFGHYDEDTGNPEWGGVWKQEDADYIAYFHPIRVLALVAAAQENERLRKERDGAFAHYNATVEVGLRYDLRLRQERDDALARVKELEGDIEDSEKARAAVVRIAVGRIRALCHEAAKVGVVLLAPELDEIAKVMQDDALARIEAARKVLDDWMDYPDLRDVIKEAIECLEAR